MLHSYKNTVVFVYNRSKAVEIPCEMFYTSFIGLLFLIVEAYLPMEVLHGRLIKNRNRPYL